MRRLDWIGASIREALVNMLRDPNAPPVSIADQLIDWDPDRPKPEPEPLVEAEDLDGKVLALRAVPGIEAS